MLRRAELGKVHYLSDRFASKLRAAQQVIGEALSRCKRPYVAYSGGKDSLAVLALVGAQRPETEIVWIDEELIYPEVDDHIRGLRERVGNQLTIVLSSGTHARWFTSWSYAPFFRRPLPHAIPEPTTWAGSSRRPAVRWLSSQGYDLTFLGTRAEESIMRRRFATRFIFAYPIYEAVGGLRCWPIWDWSSDDVWALIAGWGLPYSLVYERLEAAGIGDKLWRVGPLPLTPRRILASGWPDLLTSLEARYGRWSERGAQTR